jgi:hypothetical protein
VANRSASKASSSPARSLTQRSSSNTAASWAVVAHATIDQTHVANQLAEGLGLQSLNGLNELWVLQKLIHQLTRPDALDSSFHFTYSASGRSYGSRQPASIDDDATQP